MLAFAKQWMKFVMTKYERGRGTRPRYERLSIFCICKHLLFCILSVDVWYSGSQYGAFST